MLDELLDNDGFRVLMKMHIYECIELLLQNDIRFSILSNMPYVKFDPALPSEIMANMPMPVVLFTLDGYTYESTKLTQNYITFEAGFGSENFASFVKIPLGAIVQILVENSPILVNFSIHKENSNDIKTKESMAMFLSNPQNRELFKKK